MKYPVLGYRLPYFLSKRLFGDRRKWGFRTQTKDATWIEWQKTYLNFYEANQKTGAGDLVNHAGYRIMSRVDLRGKKVLEIGPGDIRHIGYWKSKPASYAIADIQQEMLYRSSKILEQAQVQYSSILIKREENKLPFEDHFFDVVVSFYSLEHIYPLYPQLEEINRILKPDGVIAGAIPAEGGLAWGTGRYLTSRRWLKKHTTIDPDKLICWEHPNFADGILHDLGKVFSQRKLVFWPSVIPVIDVNLIVSFIYQKAEI